MPKSEHEEGPQFIPIKIGTKEYKAPKTPMTAEELRKLADPDIGPELDLWLTVPGPKDDELIKDGASVDLQPGMHFYTAPRTINPGAKHAAS